MGAIQGCSEFKMICEGLDEVLLCFYRNLSKADIQIINSARRYQIVGMFDDNAQRKSRHSISTMLSLAVSPLQHFD